MPTTAATSESSTTRRGETDGKNRGMPAAASNIVSDSGVILMPVSIAERPRATERYSGITKNRPIMTTNWKKNITRPPVICRLANSDGVTSGSLPAASSRRTCSMKSQIATNPPRITR